jgi:lipid-binding SYLF domain-containing protein
VVIDVEGTIHAKLGPASTPSWAETGQVAFVFTKGGFILGVGRGEGVLTLRGKHYPFTVSGMSVGFAIGASTTKLVGRATNLTGPPSIEGTYGAIGAGGAVAAGPEAFNCKMPMA